MIQINGIELSTGKILEENLIQSAFPQTLGDKFTFQKDNNPKHKAKYTLELLTKMTLNVPEWPSYSFDLNQLENLW
uniref:Transposase n=1 Tax=Oncorhynchus tshawytscha TaxID=74940 RepID=A0AAZ3R042_ONCTS